ncbi:dihydroxyacetone kinase phosphoryl donor subunit DhaM [Streptococcus sp. sy010]|uniref:dihydroxyacetone kinase phosphoryl donor subunit DhaM n=1 Tax=Streptococcus sp. sy010 TaxID=2600148 RepID=UPI0011B399DE|nr:dihydroxyacetone kinase phosphoryl donor subunit DhaM [Streptococcus sp. sy010]TWT16417.1 PTS-dependent dihydroxyacetone kinase phosphotransferase subunit DhaM [Streptococcus sp. sy010]
MADLGIVLVSHSKDLAQGVVNLINQVAKDVPVTYVGGLLDGSIGTSFEQIEAIVADNPCSQLLAFYDLGSARMNLEMVADLSDKTLLIQDVPVLEGTYAAAALLQAGVGLEDILEQLKDLIIVK